VDGFLYGGCVHDPFKLFVSQQKYDNGDTQLDSTEFLKFIQHNETAINVTSPYAEEENNRLLRSHTHIPMFITKSTFVLYCALEFLMFLKEVSNAHLDLFNNIVQICNIVKYYSSIKGLFSLITIYMKQKSF